jgi:F0F1-type ATP synthase membrane subunit b/b'
MRRRLKRAAAIALPLVLGAGAAFASEGGGHEAMPLDKILWEMGIKVLDVSIIAFFGFKYLSKPITQAMASRSADVQHALDDAKAGQREAEARLAELKAKTAGLDREIEALRVQAAGDMERERAMLVQEGQAAAEHVAQHARETIRQEFVKARAELHRDAADLAVRLAEEHVRAAMSAEDQRRLAGGYLKEMETVR